MRPAAVRALVAVAPHRCLFCSVIVPPPTSTLFPYTTLFRSRGGDLHVPGGDVRAAWQQQRARPPETRSSTLRSEEHTSELQSLRHLVCRLLLEKKKTTEYAVDIRPEEVALPTQVVRRDKQA